MKKDWWVQGQRYTAPGDIETIVRAGAQLYMRRPGDERFRELAIIEDRTAYGPGHNAGDFVFEDRITGDAGVLHCTGDSCTVQYNGRKPVEYSIECPYGDIGTPVRLYEIDHRERPASLFRIGGTTQLVYFSGWWHSDQNDMHRLYVIDGSSITELPRPRDVSQRSRYLCTIAVDGYGNLHVPLSTNPGNGEWNGMTLERLDLADYNIVHDEATGNLVSITPKG